MNHVVRDETTSFVGRVRELTMLSERLATGARLLTITGPGGVGKTRLALRFTRAPVETGIVDGVCFCDLRQTTTVEGLCVAIAQELSVNLEDRDLGDGGNEMVGRVASLIAAQGETLFVLDGFDHLVDIGAAALQHWMKAAPLARFVVTSRETMRLDEEQRCHVGPFEAPPANAPIQEIATFAAVTLFVDRARAVRPDFALNSANARPIATLIRELDGIALAIELAARHGMVEGISKTLQAVRGGTELRELDGSRSIRASVQQSWEILDDAERSMLCQLSVFTGGFDRDALSAVVELALEPHRSIPDVLESLKAKSLIRCQASGERGQRCELLSAVRRFAAGMLDDSGAAAMRRARHFHSVEQPVELASDAAHPDRENLLEIYRDALDSETPHYALSAVNQLEAHYALHGPQTAYADMVRAALDATPDDSEHRALRARGLGCLARAQMHTGHVGEALVLLRRAIELASEADDALTAAECAIDIATASIGRDHGEQAYSNAKARFERVASRRSCGALTWKFRRLQALRAQRDGQHAEAESHLHNLAQSAVKACAVLAEMTILMDLGRSLTMRGHSRDARRHLMRCLDHLRRYPNAPMAVEANFYAGVVCAAQGRRHEASSYFETCISRANSSQANIAQAAFSQANISQAAFSQAAPEPAAHYRGEAHGRLAVLAIGASELEQARDHAHRAIASFQQSRQSAKVAYWMAMAACVEALSGRFDDAERELGHAATIKGGHPVSHRDDFDMGTFTAIVTLARANHLATMGQVQPAVSLFEEIRPFVQQASESTPQQRLVDAILHAYWDRTGRAAWAQHHQQLEIANAGGWFRLDGERVELGRRKALRGALSALADRATQAPGAILTAEELFEAGWPGQVARRDSMKNRVYVTVNALRKVGLQHVLQTHEGGYRLDPAVQVSIADCS